MKVSQEKYDELAALIEEAIRLQSAAEQNQLSIENAVSQLSELSTTISESVEANLYRTLSNSLARAGLEFTRTLAHANEQARYAAREYKKAGDRFSLKSFAWQFALYICGLAALSAFAWFLVFPAAQESANWETKARYYFAETQKLCKSPSIAKSPECKPYVTQ